jgi:hypothetical protein
MLWREQVHYQWDDDEVRFVLNQHAELDFYSASSLKQQSAGRNVTPFGHIIPIPSQPIFAHSLPVVDWFCVYKPYKNTNFDKEDILTNHKSSLNIPINEENWELSTFYWIPKFQKNQYLNRYILVILLLAWFIIRNAAGLAEKQQILIL